MPVVRLHTRIDLVTSWQAFLDGGKGHEPEVDERFARLSPDRLQRLSHVGTTGGPKGVMLTHHNLAWTARAGLSAYQVDTQDVMVSYLPLSHIAEQMLTVYIGITAGVKVYFAGGIDNLRDTLLAARPTVLFGVPRVWKNRKPRSKPSSPSKTDSASRDCWARDVGSRVGHYRIESGSPVWFARAGRNRRPQAVFTKIRSQGTRSTALCGVARRRFAKMCWNFPVPVEHPDPPGRLVRVFGAADAQTRRSQDRHDWGRWTTALPGTARDGGPYKDDSRRTDSRWL